MRRCVPRPFWCKMGFLAGLGAAVSAVSGIKGLFSKEKKGPTPQQNLMSQAAGARAAAEKHGFNPLTMLQYGQTGASTGGGGGVPPLASVEAITDGLTGLDDILSGDKARRAAADQLEIDLARLKLDQLRSGVVHAPVARVDTVGTAPSVLGRRAAVYAPSAGATFSRPVFSSASAPPAPSVKPVGKPITATGSVYAPGRKVDKTDLVNSPGVFQIENAITHGPVTMPGEGEPLGIDELATMVIIGGPQAAGNYVNKQLFDGKRVDTWWKDKMKQREKSNAEAKRRQEKLRADEARRNRVQ